MGANTAVEDQPDGGFHGSADAASDSVWRSHDRLVTWLDLKVPVLQCKFSRVAMYLQVMSSLYFVNRLPPNPMRGVLVRKKGVQGALASSQQS